MDTQQSTESLPNRIKPLDTQLVNRIAAGEVIQRPFNALKELMENCLDAGATHINIQIKDGGLKLLQIQDNGCGIDKQDLNIICERFTTSKLKEFDDLRSISTFGFRGEALASISHVSRLSIMTKTANNPCAYKASYTDGKLAPDGIKPCAAASKGTQITVEDLFYNTTIRRNALRSNSEEFSKIYDVVSKYAIHNYHVSFFLKRLNENNFDLKTPGLDKKENKERCIENESVLIENISTVHGQELGKELERICIAYEENFNFEMNGYISNTRFSQLKQMIFILFINERLVDCQPLKKTLQTLFALYMPKNSYPFVYINLKMSPFNLDVNIHPTKHEVRFLYQDEIINKIQVCIEEYLLNSSTSKTYYVKNLTMETFMPISKTTFKEPETPNKDTERSPVVPYPYQLTRVDSKERKLDSFKHQTSLDSSITRITNNSINEADDSTIKSPLRRQKLDRTMKLKSLEELREKVEQSTSKKVRSILQDMNFVGCLEFELALLQHKTGLYIVNTCNLSQELFYQLALFSFGNFGYFRFNNPISLYDLALIALDDPDIEWSPEDGEKTVLAKRCTKLLLSKAELLNDYFSIKIIEKDEQIFLETLPMLLEDYEPELTKLPMFILRLASEVSWKKEKSCFNSICYEISLYYSIKNIPDDNLETSDLEENTFKKPKKPSKEWIIEHVIYPSFRNMLLPSVHSEEHFFKLVDLHDLYKVFERC